jgi:hypothetical protein
MVTKYANSVFLFDFQLQTIQCVSIDPTGNYCCLVNHEGYCMVYNIKGDAMANFDLVKKWKAHDRYILKCQWSPDGK